MRKTLALCLILLVPTVADAAGSPLNLDTTTRLEMTDCASGGTAGATLAAGTYLMRVTGEDSFLCYASSCASPNGEKWPVGTIVAIAVGSSGQAFSCRSSGSTGDIILTRLQGY